MDQKEQKPKKSKRPKEPIIINVSDCQYPVVRYVARKIFNWVVTNDAEVPTWDVWWTDGAVFSDMLGRMQPHQKVNHFPGMYSLARKNHLGRNLMKMQKQFPQEYNYFPQTWLLPAELSDFRANVGKGRTFILKPEASCQGKGIMLVKDAQNISINEHYVAQRYISKPLLIDGLKFDLRIYVLVAGCDPLRLYIFKEGLARFATEEYVKPNKDNMENLCMHLTNYAINKENDNFIFNESAEQLDVGHKRSMTSVLNQLRQQGVDVDKLWLDIKQMMLKTLCAVQPVLAHQYKSCQPQNYMNNMCFEILGMDVMLDHKYRPYLLEVNHSPSFTTDTPLDAQIKRQLISQALVLMNVNTKKRSEIQQQEKQIMQQRMLSKKPTKLSVEEKQQLIQECQMIREQYEREHLGNYEKIYPFEQMNVDYDKYVSYAAQLYEESTGTNQKALIKRQQQSEKILPQQVPLRKFRKDPSAMTLGSEESTITNIQKPRRFISIKSRFQLTKSESKPKSTTETSTSKRIISKTQLGNFITPKLFMINPQQ